MAEQPQTSTNHPPIANAGSDQTIMLSADTIYLDGSASADPDKNINSYSWLELSGPSVASIDSAHGMRTRVTHFAPGGYMFELEVTDSGGLAAKDTVMITVEADSISDHPPVANAGIDETITLPTNAITLDGSGSFDIDNDITSYLWTKISGPSSLTIDNANVVQAHVASLVEGIYQFQLNVTDALGTAARDTVTISVLPEYHYTEITVEDLKWFYSCPYADVSGCYLADFTAFHLLIQNTTLVIPDSAKALISVWVKMDSVSDWKQASSVPCYMGNADFSYSFTSSALWIDCCRWETTLAGRKAEVKIRF